MLYEKDGRIGRITLNRPELMNAIDDDLPVELAAAVKQADADPAIHVMVLSGNGHAACQAYQAFIYLSEGFSGWWASSADIEAKVGGRADLTFQELAVLSFEYKVLEPNKAVRLICISGSGPWQNSEVVFELEQTEDQVFLTPTHQNDHASEDDFLYFSTKWPVYLLSLRDLAETGEGRPYPNDIKIHYGD